MRKQKLLNIGCGNTFHTDWVNIDLYSNSPHVMAHDIRKDIPFSSNYFYAVYSAHLLEHLTDKEGNLFLKEIYRVLKKNGIVRLVVPDLEMICKLYVNSVKKNWLHKHKKDVALFHSYDWVKTELMDQMTREYSGGRMKELIHSYSDIRPFIRSRLGSEADGILLQQHKTIVNKIKMIFQYPFSFYIEQIKFYVCSVMVFLIGGNTYVQYFKIGRFRNSGEIHKTMYDKYSLYKLLSEVGFTHITVKTAFTSDIEKFSDYQLDVCSNNVRKPDSLYIEARKP